MRFLSPPLFFAGLLVGLISSIAAGWYLAAMPLFGAEFQRFHKLIGAESLFHAPVSQITATARARSAGKIAVIVAGDSAFRGHGQSVADLWSGELQRLLGDGFAVINLAVDGAHGLDGPAPFVAESLHKEGQRTILLFDVRYLLTGEVFGRIADATYSYPAWAAHFSGTLERSDLRDARVRERMGDAKISEASMELRLRALLNGTMRFEELWSWIGYHHLFTAWSGSARAHFTRPKKSYSDREPSYHWDGPKPLVPAEKANIDRNIGNLLATSPTTVRGTIQERAASLLPPSLSLRSLVVLTGFNPEYLRHLPREDHAHISTLLAAASMGWQDAGFHPLVAGDWLLPEDYCDSVHYSPAGGRKLAATVAPIVRKIAESDFPAMRP